MDILLNLDVEYAPTKINCLTVVFPSKNGKPIDVSSTFYTMRPTIIKESDSIRVGVNYGGFWTVVVARTTTCRLQPYELEQKGTRQDKEPVTETRVKQAVKATSGHDPRLPPRRHNRNSFGKPILIQMMIGADCNQINIALTSALVSDERSYLKRYLWPRHWSYADPV